MFTTIRRSLPAAALIGGMLVVSATTGAVAAGMITGASIKDGTVTSADLKNNNVSTKDIKDGTLLIGDFSDAAKSSLQGAPGSPGAPGAPGAPGVSGLELVSDTKAIASATHSSLLLTCPAGKSVISVTGDWASSYMATSSKIQTSTSAYVYGDNTSASNDTLRGWLLCATVG